MEAHMSHSDEKVKDFEHERAQRRQKEASEPRNERIKTDSEEEANDDIADAEESAKAAAVAARRYAHNGVPEAKARKLIKRRFPPAEAAVVRKAYAWYERYQPGKRVGHQLMTDLSAVHKRFARLEAPGCACAIVLRSEGRVISEADFKLRLSGELVVDHIGRDGDIVCVNASTAWQRAGDKHVYRRLVFSSGSVPFDALNLWRGWGVAPRQGEWPLLRQHIHEVLAAGDEQVAKALLMLIGWQMQNVGRPSRVMTLLWCDQQQTGRGLFLEKVLLPIWGEAGFFTVSLEDVTGQFNEVLWGKGLVILDEALFAGDRRGASKLKGLMATQTLSINGKNKPIVRVPGALNFWVMSNSELPLFVEEKDVRHWVIRTSPAKAGDHAYFAKLVEEIEGGGREAFLWDVLHDDVSSFVPQRDVPMANVAKAELKERVMNPADPTLWLRDSAECGVLLGVAKDISVNEMLNTPVDELDCVPWREGDEVRSGLLWQGYIRWSGRQGPHKRLVSRPEFWRALTEAGFEASQDNTGSWRRLPPCPF
jgi:hypothetical protein